MEREICIICKKIIEEGEKPGYKYSKVFCRKHRLKMAILCQAFMIMSQKEVQKIFNIICKYDSDLFNSKIPKGNKNV